MKTIRVRIAVAMNEYCDWCAFGGSEWRDDDSMANEAFNEVSESRSQRCFFVEADIPVPEPETIEGTVLP